MRYPLFLAVVAALVAACLWRGASVTLLGFVLGALVPAVCIWAMLCHLSALRRDHDLAIVQAGVWWRGWVGGHAIRCILALPAALWTGATLALSALTVPVPTLVAAPVVALVAWSAARFWGAQVDPAVIPAQRARFVLPPVMVLSGLAGGVVLVLMQASSGSLARDVGMAAHYVGPSLILGQIFDLQAILAGVAGQAAALGPWAWPLRAVMVASVAFGLGSIAAAALVPPARLIAPSGVLRPARLTVTGFVAVIGVYLLLHGAALLEGQVTVALGAAPDQPRRVPVAGDLPRVPVQNRAPGHVQPVLPLTAIRRAIEAERIAGLLCPPGTDARLESLQSEIDSLYAGQAAHLAQVVRGGFDGMRANVPAFLDWYYSLGAEYLRTANLLIGSGEDYLNGKVTEYLDAGAPLATIDSALAGLAENPRAAAVAAEVTALMQACGADLPQDAGAVVIVAERPGAQLVLPAIADRITLQDRLAAAGLGGLAAGVGVAVLAKVGAKLAVSSAFKAAAAALAKIAGGKAIGLLGGMGIGAAAGGAGGSVLPGAGTAAGAVIGGIVGGIAVMLGVDFGLLKLEEAVSRAAFETEIVAAIDATEAEVLGAMGIDD